MILDKFGNWFFGHSPNQEPNQDPETPSFHKRNHQVGCWMDPDLWKWFLQYLDKYSYGESRSEKFGALIYELQKIE
jgi:hypothetical protein